MDGRRKHHDRHGTRGPAGPGGRFFAPGELRLALLDLLAERPGHGYELMTRLEARFDGAYRASAGAVYPTLQQIADELLVSTRPDAGRKVFHLTDEGRAEIAAHTDDIARIWARASARADWSPLRDPNAAEILAPALRLMKAAVATIVRAHGDPATIDRVRAVLEHARRELKAMDRERKQR